MINFGTKSVNPTKAFCVADFMMVPKDTFERSEPYIDLIKVPIRDDNEYCSIFRGVVHEYSNNGQLVWVTLKDWEKYKNISMIERGLVPYVGFGPGYRFINMYLRNDLTPENRQKYKQFLPMNEDSVINVIRTLEYSLQKLDSTYGKYKGIVYRQGYMNENPRQYISTSINPVIVSNIFHGKEPFAPYRSFSIIRTSCGHKINEFQRKAGVAFAENEEEILLPYDNKYRKLSENEIDAEMLVSKEEFAKSLYNALQCSSSSPEIKEKYTKERLFDLIDCYEEV